MDSTPRAFNSVEDECRYWKERAKQYHKEWTDVKQEYDEYVEQSRQMEAEMDATLDQKQGIIKDLRLKITSLENENESLRHKLESQSTDLTSIEKQFDEIKTQFETIKEEKRMLEQKNDDLERAQRILNETVADIGSMLDKAYEKNALLEMEVDEKGVLQEKLQRLMDETRDLKQEMNVKTRYQANGLANSSTNPTSNGLVGNGDVSNATITPPTATSPTANDNKNHFQNHHHHHHSHHRNSNLNGYNQQLSLKSPDNLINGNAMAPSSRTTALNIVADMLRKLNLDKPLLCPQCDRFRCVCNRPIPSPSTPSNSGLPASSTGTETGIKRISRSLTSTFGGSKDSANTTPNMTQATTPKDASTELDSFTSSSKNNTSNSTGVVLNRSSSCSNNSLNSGTNIFKRLAERISGSASLLATTIPTTNSTNTTPLSNSMANE